MEVLIAPTATTAIKKVINVTRDSLPISLIGWGFAGAEVLTLEIPNRVGADPATDAHWNAWKIGTVAQVLSADNNRIEIDTPIILRISKTAQADANGIGCATLS